MNGKKMKKHIYGLLQDEDFDNSLELIRLLPARKAVNPLFSYFYSGDMMVRWRAISAMGAVVSSLFRQDRESARVVMRRLMWNLNDESGGIGWGSPEAMGEIMAESRGLANEFVHMLKSYLNPAGNYLEHEILQQGVLWGHGRLARARSQLLGDAVPLIKPFLSSKDPIHRGLAAWTLNALPEGLSDSERRELESDRSVINIYIHRKFVNYQISQLVQ